MSFSIRHNVAVTKHAAKATAKSTKAIEAMMRADRAPLVTPTSKAAKASVRATQGLHNAAAAEYQAKLAAAQAESAAFAESEAEEAAWVALRAARAARQAQA